jgi:acyl-CoA synthetase (AMP-forming)/AMP-acid ligase II
MYQGYGRTEVVPVAMMGPAQWFATDIPGSTPLRACGLPLPFAQLQIWDEDNKPVPAGTPGEIVAKTDGQMTPFGFVAEVSHLKLETVSHGTGNTKQLGVFEAMRRRSARFQAHLHQLSVLRNSESNGGTPRQCA